MADTFWQDSYYTDSKGNKKKSRNRVATVNGKQIVEGSLDDIYDEYGNIDRAKENAVRKNKDATDAAGMSGVSKNVIPNSTEAQNAIVRDTAKEFNVSEKKAGGLAGRVLGGNNSTPAKAEPIKVEPKVETPKVEKEETAPKTNDISNYEGVKRELDDYKNIVDKIEDYYKDSIGSGLDELSSRDKKILALEHIGTTIKNLSKMQPYLGSIYGRQHEEVGAGDEKSMLQNVVETNLKGGLDRRNKRMSAALDQQIKMSNFPSDLKMKMSEIANANNLDFYQKKRLIDIEVQKYAKTAGIDLDMYNKKSVTDVSKDKAIRENAANAPYRPTGSISAGPITLGAS